ncbi:YfcC family protein [Ihubacter sp. mB4P-1]|uniref:YfcC family protein n=1 Tax=Ihubacter sp. mB4P-1 TaxID=3242370 RepID=UPI001379D110
MKKKKLSVPHVYIILLALILLCGLLTYVIPAGQYDMTEVNGRSVVDSSTYHTIEQTPVTPMSMLTSISRGLQESAQIIFFIFIVGGAIAVIQSTGAIEAAIGKVAIALRGKDILIIPISLLIFGLGGAIFGMGEETIPLVPIFVSLCIAMGYDSITGAALILCGGAIGFAGEMMNPFALQVAQGIAGLPALSGMWFRAIIFSVFLVVTVAWIMRYARRIKATPTLSPMYEFDRTREDVLNLDDLPPFGFREKIIIAVFFAAVAIMVFGVIKWGWYMDEIAAVFLAASIICAIVGKVGFNRYAIELGKGMADICSGALVVGFARAIVIVLEEGNILHVILHGAAGILETLPAALSAFGMYVFQCLLNFVIVSGSGQAAVTMPIMAPLSDLVDVTRQTAVVAFSIGNGLSNILTPVSGVLMASLALAKIPWEKFAKWLLPLIGIQYLIGGVFVIIAQLIEFGPF